MKLNEAIEYYDSLAEECRRKASIQRNDYMDLRDEPAEYSIVGTDWYDSKAEDESDGYSQLADWLATSGALIDKLIRLENSNSLGNLSSCNAAAHRKP